MNILISPQAFKGSISAIDVANYIEKGINKANPNITTTKIPVADGGDDTLETLVSITNGQIYNTKATGPDGTKISTSWGALGDNKTAVIEMAKISGLALLNGNIKDPKNYTTYGLGEIIKECLDLSYSKFIIGIGGSATNDGGAGMAQALGANLFDNKKKEIKRGSIGLKNLKSINLTNLDQRIKNCEFLVACDVNNPLHGPNVATFTFGPQKGFNDKDLCEFDKYMKNYGDLIDINSGYEISKVPGSGAAGGLGAGFMFFVNGTLKSGSQIILDYINFESQCKNADIVITGEGQIDFQTINNKAPIAVARIAKKHNIPTFAICGVLGKDFEKVYQEGIEKVYPICKNESEKEYAISNASKLIEKTAYDLIKQNFI